MDEKCFCLRRCLLLSCCEIFLFFIHTFFFYVASTGFGVIRTPQVEAAFRAVDRKYFVPAVRTFVRVRVVSFFLSFVLTLYLSSFIRMLLLTRRNKVTWRIPINPFEKERFIFRHRIFMARFWKPWI